MSWLADSIWGNTKKDEPKVYFETENWAVRKYAPIKPASDFIPSQWKKLSLIHI